jgi:2C-methyl-D-erythritol 2,4-cyclodiphosphate synthase
MKTSLYKPIFAALLLAVVISISACSSAKDEQLKYHNDILTIVEKADSSNTLTQNLLKNTAQNLTPETINAAIEAVKKLETDFTTRKANLAKIAAPKFDDFNLKSSTDKWLDLQIKGLTGERAMYENIAQMLKVKMDMAKVSETGEEPSEEIKGELARLQGINAENMKKYDEQAALEVTAKNEIRSSSEKFTTKYELKKSK